MPATDSSTVETNVLDSFTLALRSMTPDDIRRRATQLHTTGDDLDWWRTTLDVDRRLRDAHLSRRAAAAAIAARDAVLAAATGPTDDVAAEVVPVSRAAADTARALVAGCRLTDATSFTVSCEPVAPSNPHRTTSHPTAA